MTTHTMCGQSGTPSGMAHTRETSSCATPHASQGPRDPLCLRGPLKNNTPPPYSLDCEVWPQDPTSGWGRSPWSRAPGRELRYETPALSSLPLCTRFPQLGSTCHPQAAQSGPFLREECFVFSLVVKGRVSSVASLTTKHLIRV